MVVASVSKRRGALASHWSLRQYLRGGGTGFLLVAASLRQYLRGGGTGFPLVAASVSKRRGALASRWSLRRYLRGGGHWLPIGRCVWIYVVQCYNKTPINIRVVHTVIENNTSNAYNTTACVHSVITNILLASFKEGKYIIECISS